jgi:tRNA G10  N-methylase Trm11
MLDPFAGHGALPAARARLPYNMIFAIEADAALVAELKGRKKDGRLPERKKAPLIVRQGDARRLESLDESFVDAVVTDPPWGLYDRGQTDLPGLYRAVADELARVLKPGGRLVMLLGRGEATAALRAHAPARGLRETAAYDILVSGKKATAVKWIRVSAGDTGDDG